MEKFKSRFQKNRFKFWVEVTLTVKDALNIDQDNGNTLWYDYIGRNTVIILVRCAIDSSLCLQSLCIFANNVATFLDVPLLVMISDGEEIVSASASLDSIWRTVTRFSKTSV